MVRILTTAIEDAKIVERLKTDTTFNLYRHNTKEP